MRSAIEASGSRVALIAIRSLSQRIQDDPLVDAGTRTISDEFYRQVDFRALDRWRERRHKEFTAMLPPYATCCYGEGWMDDTAMPLGALGWDRYASGVEVVTPYFASSGAGQVHAVFVVD